MGRSKISKFIGSCGMYVFVIPAGDVPWVLVHRRSTQVSEPKTIAAPGGIVEHSQCGVSNNFEIGARRTAVKELFEETGVGLAEDVVAGLSQLPVGDGAYWGKNFHRNYYVTFHDFPPIRGPEKASLHEVVVEGMNGIGRPAGDGFHAWVKVCELLGRCDLMPQCRVPLAHFNATFMECKAADVSGNPAEDALKDTHLSAVRASQLKLYAVRPVRPTRTLVLEDSLGGDGRASKRPRGSVAKCIPINSS